MNALCVATKGRIEGGGIGVATSGRVCRIEVLAPAFEYVCNKLKVFMVRYSEIKAYLQR